VGEEFQDTGKLTSFVENLHGGLEVPYSGFEPYEEWGTEDLPLTNGVSSKCAGI
jgi:hypothetical protein